MNLLSLGTVGFALVLTLNAVAGPADDRANWPQWRGPLASGLAPEADPPRQWSETSNLKWKVAIPGSSLSTPAVWGDRVFVLTAASADQSTAAKSRAEKVEDPGKPTASPPPAGAPPGGFGRSEKPTKPYRFMVLCLDRASGKIIWEKVAREVVPHEAIQANNSFASASPITDGQIVLAFFGSRGLYCYDLQGNLKWSKDLGQMRTRNSFGEGASPALHGDTVVVNWDDETENDFIVALDKRDGKELWRTPRHEDTGWSTPLIVEQEHKWQVIVNATSKVRSYDLATGKEIWSCSGQTPNAIPSPVADADTVYCTSGFRGSALYAIKLTASGDVSGTDAIRWKRSKGTPYVPSPLLVDGLLYYLSGNTGMLNCLNTETGQMNYEQERLPELREVYASPVAAKDRVYVLGRDGTCVVIRKGPKPEVLSTNKLDDKTDASIALAGKQLFIRGKQNLYCIEEK